MAPLLIILGLVCGFFGACNAISALSERTQTLVLADVMLAVVFGVPGILLLIYGVKRAARPRTQVGNTRKCPFCAEYVKPEATVCRHCQRDLPAANPDSN